MGYLKVAIFLKDHLDEIRNDKDGFHEGSFYDMSSGSKDVEELVTKNPEHYNEILDCMQKELNRLRDCRTKIQFTLGSLFRK